MRTVTRAQKQQAKKELLKWVASFAAVIGGIMVFGALHGSNATPSKFTPAATAEERSILLDACISNHEGDVYACKDQWAAVEFADGRQAAQSIATIAKGRLENMRNTKTIIVTTVPQQ